jgi:hypothetical protein
MAGVAGIATYNFARFGSVSDIGYGSPSANLGGTMWVGLLGLLFSSGRGMFVYAPVLLVAAAGWNPFWRTRRRIAMAIVCIVVPYTLFHARLLYWDGGGCWSPRYIAPILPFLMFGVAAFVDRGMSSARWFALGLVGTASVIVQLLGVVIGCVPYTFKMLQTKATAELLFWHPKYSPLADHLNSVVRQKIAIIHLAPAFAFSTPLAWLHTMVFAAGVILLVTYVRSILNEAGRGRARA